MCINQFDAIGLFQDPPENIRKLLSFLCFQGVKKETIGIKKVNMCHENTK